MHISEEVCIKMIYKIIKGKLIAAAGSEELKSE